MQHAAALTAQIEAARKQSQQIQDVLTQPGHPSALLTINPTPTY